MNVYNSGMTVDYGTANAAVAPVSTMLAALPTLRGFGGDPTGVVGILAALTAALADVATVYLGAGTWALNNDFTIASGKNVVLMPGATLNVLTAKTLTVTGHLVVMPGAAVGGSGTVTNTDLVTFT